MRGQKGLVNILLNGLCYTCTIKKIISTDKLYVAKSQMPDAGRGVFAQVAIPKGEIIEKCPVIEIPKHDVAALSHSILLTYFYFFGKAKEKMVVALGFGSIYNHTYSPNATYKELEEEQAIAFIAIKDIKKDEEITVNYVQENKVKHPLWFDISKSE